MYLYAISFITGVVVSAIIFRLCTPRLGRFEINESDPENVKWRIVIEKDLEFSKIKRLYLKVDDISKTSHE